ncbi:MAG: hypothetical protein MMC33_003192 [Icmadophila ericetorum]|nr:hypothetical protein [Icmadophila ericetorum]
MPTNRPFLFNFFAAFRAHSALQNASSSTTAASTIAVSQSTHLNSPSATNQQGLSPTSTARGITTKSPTTGLTTAAVQAAAAAGHLSHTHHTRHPSSTTSPVSRSPRSPGTNLNHRRRGSDSSSEGGGFRDALGNEKWYIGGRTAQGEERIYRLGMVKRERSGDRLSLDRLSL